MRTSTTSASPAAAPSTRRSSARAARASGTATTRRSGSSPTRASARRSSRFINPEPLNIQTDAAGRFVSSTPKPWLLASPQPGSFGNFPINSLNGPNYFNIDASLVKRLAVTGRFKLELKTTFINILNRANFVYNTQNFDATDFGRVTATGGDPRIVHFTFKATWWARGRAGREPSRP